MKKIFTIIACLCALSASAQIAEVSAPRPVTDRTAPARARAAQAAPESAVKVRTGGSQLFITKNGVERAFTPVECYAGYVWATLSPDATKVAFVAAGKGLVICDTDGNVIARPGKRYEAPSWFGNNHLLVQNATDDGHQLSSSQILLITLDGKQLESLTAPESMTLEPVGDIDNNRIYFTTIDGIEYEQSVTLK